MRAPTGPREPVRSACYPARLLRSVTDAAVLHHVVFPPRWMRLLALLGFTVVAANLFWHGSQPYAVGAIPPPWDKLVHLVLYGCFGAAAWVALGGVRPAADWLAPMAAIAVGVADEVAQGFNPGRSVGVDDVVADAIGAVLAVAILSMLRERLRRTGVPS